MGTHAFLSASNYHWINYDEEKLIANFMSSLAAKRGTELHALAHQCIRLGVKLPATRQTLNLYVNDAIGFKMTPEQVLYYSPQCYGTADCISFRKNFLRIHDLKTGMTPGSVHQLEVYAALFCHEYEVLPTKLAGIELRIYQNNDFEAYLADPDVITHIMDRIVTFDRLIREMRLEAES